MIDEKIQQAIGILKEKDIDMWLTFVRETGIMADPIVDYIVGTGVTWQTAFIITSKGDTIAIAGSLDVANLEAHHHYQKVVSYVQSIRDDLVSTLKRLDPQKIAINYSPNIPAADGLSTGMYMQLLEYLAGTSYVERLVSAEGVITALRGRKTAEEIKRMKEAIRITLEIFYQVGEFIRPGRTEKEIAAFVLDKVDTMQLETAWGREHCPAVFTGPDTAGAHAAPTDRAVEPGHLVNMDFGVKYQKYCADLQRTWYVLKPGESEPPAEVQRGFRVLKEAIDKVAAALKPGVIGKDMDHIARQHLLDNGYEEYPHGLGHQVGREAHDGGALLGPDWERYGETPFIPVEEGEVYTIEPRLNVAGHGIVTVEEEVWVKKDGSEFISDPQEELWLIDERKV